MKIDHLLLVCVIATSCNEASRETPKNVSDIKPAIEIILDDWHTAAAEANFEAYFNAMDSASVFIGTDATEVWSKKEFADFSKPHFDKGKAWDFKVLDRNIYMSKSQEVAWFDEILETWMGTCRGSGVLEKQADGWRIKHYVLSVAIPNEDIDTVIQVKNYHDSIFLKNFQKHNN